MNAKVIRGVRKLERPRPLKTNSDSSLRPSSSPTILETLSLGKPVTDLLNDLENLHISISIDCYNGNTVDDIAKISDILKVSGSELDASYKDQIDRYFVTFRNISREDQLERISRMRLLELIELRAMGWRTNENFSDYYRRKIKEELEVQERNIPPPIPPPTVPVLPLQPSMISPNSVILEPGEVLRSSGKFIRPARIAGKNFFKDEIVIRNSDSGKVTPGARDRLVQITGPSEDTISRAKLLVEDTIRRNASPIREKTDNLNLESGVNENIPYNSLYENVEPSHTSFRNRLSHSLSMTDASLGEYVFSVKVGEDIVKVSGENVNLVKIARSVLDQYFHERNDEYLRELSIPSPVHFASDYSLQRTNTNKFPAMKSDLLIASHNYKEVEEKSSVSSVCSEDEPHKDVTPKNDCLSSEMLSLSTASHDHNPNFQNSRALSDESETYKYSREYLLNCSKLRCSQVEPKDLSKIKAICPVLIRLPEKMFDPKEYGELWELQSILKTEEEEEERF